MGCASGCADPVRSGQNAHPILRPIQNYHCRERMERGPWAQHFDCQIGNTAMESFTYRGLSTLLRHFSGREQRRKLSITSISKYFFWPLDIYDSELHLCYMIVSITTLISIKQDVYTTISSNYFSRVFTVARLRQSTKTLYISPFIDSGWYP